MTQVCSCNVGLGNSKVPGCDNIASVAHGLLFVPLFDDTGTRNQIDLTDTLDQAYWDAWTSNTDQSMRLRPFVSKKFQNVDLARGESMYETYDSGDMEFIQSGEKKFTAVLPNTSPAVIKFFDSARCSKVGVYVVDINGNLIGNASATGFLRPFYIHDKSIDAREIPAKDKTAQKIELKFNFAKTEEDADIGMILATELEVALLELEGLYDVYGVFSNIATSTDTTFTVDLRTHYGTVLNPNRVSGLAIGDFTLENRGTGATVTITSTTENSVTKGIYDFVVPAQTGGDKGKLTFTFTGYDSAELGEQIILFP